MGAVVRAAGDDEKGRGAGPKSTRGAAGAGERAGRGQGTVRDDDQDDVWERINCYLKRASLSQLLKAMCLQRIPTGFPKSQLIGHGSCTA